VRSLHQERQCDVSRTAFSSFPRPRHLSSAQVGPIACCLPALLHFHFTPDFISNIQGISFDMQPLTPCNRNGSHSSITKPPGTYLGLPVLSSSQVTFIISSIGSQYLFYTFTTSCSHLTAHRAHTTYGHSAQHTPSTCQLLHPDPTQL